jgi:hypothetical protein
MIFKKAQYWNRIFSAYILRKKSQLTFWHEEPSINKNIKTDEISSYFMDFRKKANYDANLDKNGIPLLDYQGSIGLQYNPIAISQWGLGNYNLWLENNSKINYEKFILSANWLLDKLTKNQNNVCVWMHDFNFEYRDTLISPWYSGLAQGQGLSLLIRAYKETKKNIYKEACLKVFNSFTKEISDGGVNYTDNFENKWIEEYIVDPPTHILNGFIWAMWGVHDFKIFFKNKEADELFESYTRTLTKNLHKYDIKYWSKYELSNKSIPMIASYFYHKLHIVQLDIMFTLTGKDIFKTYHIKWTKQLKNRIYKFTAFAHKSIFKVLYY